MAKKICSILSNLLLICLALIAAVLIIPKFLGYDQYAVLSGSMEPEIHVGAIVYAKEANIDEIKEGTIITYKISGETMVTHRVVSIDEKNQTVTTKGDANEVEDAAPVAFENIVGVYGFDVPYLGYISIYGKTPLGIAVICAVLIVIILLNFLPDALSSDEDEEKEDIDKSDKKNEK